MAAILPEKFEQGDFRVWLRQFEVCADANGWTEPQRLRKLPAFLRGLAATHFYALTDEQRDTYQNLIANLTAALCPAICRETYYTEFGERMLRSGEDPSVYLWALQELLAKAEPTFIARRRGQKYLVALSCWRTITATKSRFCRHIILRPQNLGFVVTENDPET
eukprot:gene20628-biopygen17020